MSIFLRARGRICVRCPQMALLIDARRQLSFRTCVSKLVDVGLVTHDLIRVSSLLGPKMKRFYVSLILHTLLVLSLSRFCKGDRKLYGVINPGCYQPNCDSTDNHLLYVRADGSADTIHYLWSSMGSFSVLMAQTSLDTNMTIDWETFLSNDSSESISFTDPPIYSSVMVFTRLYEFDDPDDKNDIEVVLDDDITVHPFTNLTWEAVEASNTSDKEFSATFTTISDTFSSIGNETVQIQLKVYGYEDHAKQLPHLLHTSNSFQLELILDNFATVYNHTRFVLEAFAFGNETSGEYELHSHRSIDDEYTPSVFTTIQMASPRSQDGGWGSFLQWKPICYTSSDRTTKTSTDTHQKMGHLDISNRTDELTASLLNSYAGSGELALNGSLNISYGLQDDNFYQDNHYLTWTATFGLGVPPSEKFSTLVIAVIIVGFGVPVLLIITGGIIILVRRCKSRDDELNLSSAKLFEEEEQ